MNRRLIRPHLSDMKEHFGLKPARRKPVPPEQTSAESFYYVKQMNNKTPMVIHLRDGEVLRGVIEWYDKTCIKLNRLHEPNLLIFKDHIKYMYKEHEDKDNDE